MAARTPEGWHGWDTYASFYDWENARTVGRRDVAFWKHTLADVDGDVLELGCGTGRLTMPLARAGVSVVGIDRSQTMLARAITRARRIERARRPRLVRGDIRVMPFRNARFRAVMAPYGLFQSLIRDADLTAALAECHRLLPRGGRLGIDLVPDVPAWGEYKERVSLRGRGPRGGEVTLVESVRQDRRRGLTIFDETFIERIGRRTERHTFSLTFRTLPLPDIVDRVESSGFRVDHVLGSYDGGRWRLDSDVWLILARRR
jgi:SAM-dependent methyltransferase